MSPLAVVNPDPESDSDWDSDSDDPYSETTRKISLADFVSNIDSLSESLDMHSKNPEPQASSSRIPIFRAKPPQQAKPKPVQPYNPDQHVHTYSGKRFYVRPARRSSPSNNNRYYQNLNRHSPKDSLKDLKGTKLLDKIDERLARLPPKYSPWAAMLDEIDIDAIPEEPRPRAWSSACCDLPTPVFSQPRWDLENHGPSEGRVEPSPKFPGPHSSFWIEGMPHYVDDAARYDWFDKGKSSLDARSAIYEVDTRFEPMRWEQVSAPAMLQSGKMVPKKSLKRLPKDVRLKSKVKSKPPPIPVTTFRLGSATRDDNVGLGITMPSSAGRNPDLGDFSWLHVDQESLLSRSRQPSFPDEAVRSAFSSETASSAGTASIASGNSPLADWRQRRRGNGAPRPPSGDGPPALSSSNPMRASTITTLFNVVIFYLTMTLLTFFPLYIREIPRFQKELFKKPMPDFFHFYICGTFLYANLLRNINQGHFGLSRLLVAGSRHSPELLWVSLLVAMLFVEYLGFKYGTAIAVSAGAINYFDLIPGSDRLARKVNEVKLAFQIQIPDEIPKMAIVFALICWFQRDITAYGIPSWFVWPLHGIFCSRFTEDISDASPTLKELRLLCRRARYTVAIPLTVMVALAHDSFGIGFITKLLWLYIYSDVAMVFGRELAPWTVVPAVRTLMEYPISQLVILSYTGFWYWLTNNPDEAAWHFATLQVPLLMDTLILGGWVQSFLPEDKAREYLGRWLRKAWNVLVLPRIHILKKYFRETIWLLFTLQILITSISFSKMPFRDWFFAEQTLSNKLLIVLWSLFSPDSVYKWEPAIMYLSMTLIPMLLGAYIGPEEVCYNEPPATEEEKEAFWAALQRDTSAETALQTQSLNSGLSIFHPITSGITAINSVTLTLSALIHAVASFLPNLVNNLLGNKAGENRPPISSLRRKPTATTTVIADPPISSSKSNYYFPKPSPDQSMPKSRYRLWPLFNRADIESSEPTPTPTPKPSNSKNTWFWSRKFNTQGT